MRLLGLVALLVGGHLLGWTDTSPLPSGYPTVFEPPENPASDQKVVLGERLFSDTRLSTDNTFSCASCHLPERHFTDGRKRAIGVLGDELAFNTPTLLHSAYNASFGWTDLGLTTLESQHHIPLTAQNPVEMGFDGEVLDQLNADVELRNQFAVAFGSTTVISLDSITKALASYVRSLVYLSAFDRYLLYDDQASLTSSARRGLALFTSQRLGCLACHNGFNLGGALRTNVIAQQPVFHSRTIAGKRLELRAPSLRSVGNTAPYFHDGSLPTLETVVRSYEVGQFEDLTPFTLTAVERVDLIEFLESL